jgi:hypothetical protein
MDVVVDPASTTPLRQLEASEATLRRALARTGASKTSPTSTRGEA